MVGKSVEIMSSGRIAGYVQNGCADMFNKILPISRLVSSLGRCGPAATAGNGSMYRLVAGASRQAVTDPQLAA
jgi:hypothetical protein